MKNLLKEIKKELGYVNDVDLMKVLKTHAGIQHLVTKRVNGTGCTVNLYCLNGKYIISDEKSGESFRMTITEKQNIAYQVLNQEKLLVKSLRGSL